MGGLLVTGALVIASMTWAAAAADWPTKPIRTVVPFAAGGAADSIGRVSLTQFIAREIGRWQPLIKRALIAK